MKILIVGNGARESALALKLKDDSRISKLYFAKGTVTTGQLGQNVYEDSVEGLRDFAIKERIDLTVVGPEAPLVEGIVDEFKKHDLKIFGPGKRAAELEGNERLSLVIQTICATGIRVSELRFITAEAVCCGRAGITNKGKRRTVFLPNQLCRLLKQYLKKRKITTILHFLLKHRK